MKRLGFLILILGLYLLALTSCSSNRGLQISGVWARPGLSGDNSAVYFIIDNSGQDESDRLIGVQSDIAAQVELHMSKMENGVMKMEPQESVEVAGKTKVEFQPGGLHVMLVNLKQNLNAGDTFSLTLQFEKAGAQELQVPVKEP